MRNRRPAIKLHRRLPWLILILVLSLSLLIVGAAAARPAAQADPPNSPFHPDFPLLDEQGENVLDTGLAVSTGQTCGQCHDTEFINQHSFHTSAGLEQWAPVGQAPSGRAWDMSPGIYGQWDPLTYRYLTPPGDPWFDLGTAEWLQLQGRRHVGGGPAEFTAEGTPLIALDNQAAKTYSQVLDPATGEAVPWDWQQSGTIEMNCFLCHTSQPNNQARVEALLAGDFRWANTATLVGTGVVEAGAEGYQWIQSAFDESGNLRQAEIGLGDPGNENCGLCHGLTDQEVERPLSFESCLGAGRRTATTGQVVSPQRILDSGLNIEGKADLSRPWDIHAERLVECTDCHYSLNNPVYVEAEATDQPEHLIFDPRRLELGEYLQQPIHDFARGDSVQSSFDPESLSSMRPCQSCHDADATHSWLPYSQQHMEVISCETCHVPTLYAGGLQQVDWTVYQDGPATACRVVQDPSGTPNDLMRGYEPVWLFEQDRDGGLKLTPFNLVSAWYWVHGDPPRPVRQLDLEAAWMEDGEYPVEVLAAFDNDGDGLIQGEELRIATEEQQAVIAGRLSALGLQNPRITAESQPFTISHSVATDEFAIRECSVCHGAESRLTQPFQLARFVPGGVEPTFIGGTNVLFDQDLVEFEGDSLVYRPATQKAGLYIFGHDAVQWIDWMGALVFVGVLAGVSVHGGIRLFSGSRTEDDGQSEQVYMYGVYERLWHWLQTFTISALLFTGLIIHKPDIFGAFSFRHVVLVHNILAGILVVNAFLALFYHLASGEIRQYLPKPVGFFGQAITQARYYLKGIFQDAPHPFEKTPDKKLNPLQQITYFGILNVLLPLQVLTGMLMWGVQQWPQISNSLGGLPFLAPFHSLIAWLFAAFIVAHVYLTTTSGPRALSAIQAMMLGWEEVEPHEKEQNK